MAMGKEMLELIDIRKDYESPAGTGSVTVLRDIGLKVGKGESVAVVGPSGSGKSTLLNIIGALDRPSSGRVLLEGTDISALSETVLAGLRNRKLGFVFQLHHLLSQCTVIENVLLPTIPAGGGLSKERAHKRAFELLEKVGLGEYSMHRPGELSGGQRQRVAVVRALINSPALLLADEPTGSLDKAASDNITELLVELNKAEGVTLIVVTHSARLAGRLDRVFELEDGSLKDGAGRI